MKRFLLRALVTSAFALAFVGTMSGAFRGASYTSHGDGTTVNANN